jgi:hypothetical protein
MRGYFLEDFSMLFHGKQFAELNRIELIEFFESRVRSARFESAFGGFLAGAVLVYVVNLFLPC